MVKKTKKTLLYISHQYVVFFVTFDGFRYDLFDGAKRDLFSPLYKVVRLAQNKPQTMLIIKRRL